MSKTLAPQANIAVTLTISENTITVVFALQPVAFIGAAVLVFHLTESMLESILPETNVVISIRPGHLSLAMREIVLQLTKVSSPIFEFNFFGELVGMALWTCFNPAFCFQQFIVSSERVSSVLRGRIGKVSSLHVDAYDLSDCY